MKILIPAQIKIASPPIMIFNWGTPECWAGRGIHFRNQHAIGKYVVDFCAPRKKLIIELDGSQHLEQKEYDSERTVYLESKGYKVIRFWNSEVMNDIEGVLLAILQKLEEQP